MIYTRQWGPGSELEIMGQELGENGAEKGWLRQFFGSKILVHNWQFWGVFFCSFDPSTRFDPRSALVPTLGPSVSQQLFPARPISQTKTQGGGKRRSDRAAVPPLGVVPRPDTGAAHPGVPPLLRSPVAKPRLFLPCWTPFQFLKVSKSFGALCQPMPLCEMIMG